MALSLMGLASCGDSMKRSLGLVKDSPDEFTVISANKLVVPDSLVLPKPTMKQDSFEANSVKRHLVGDSDDAYEENYVKRKFNQWQSDDGYRIVDAALEQKRIEELQAKHKPLNSSESALRHKKNNWLSKLTK